MSETRSDPRVPPLSPPYPPGIAEALDQTSPGWRDQEPLKLFRVWARHPELGQALRPIGRFLLDQGAVDPADREVVILRTCAKAGAEYEWGVHAAGYSMRAGLSQETITATVHTPTDDPAWSETERLLLRLVDEFDERIDVSDGLWAELVGRWTQPQILELLLIAGEWAARFPPRDLVSK